LPPSPALETADVDKTQGRIRWKDQGGGARYRVQMAADPGFATLLWDTRVDRPETTFARPEKAGTYYFRVSGIDREGYEGSFSQAQSLEVKRDIPWPAIGTMAAFLLTVIAL
jgi:hypothetical protein